MTRQQKIQFLKDIHAGKKSVFDALPWDLDIYSASELKQMLAVKKRTISDTQFANQEDADFMAMICQRQLEHRKKTRCQNKSPQTHFKAH